MLNSRRTVVIESMENRLHFDASQLTETIVSSTLPATISDQAVLKGTITVDVTNNSGADEKEQAVVGLTISNGTLDTTAGNFSPLKSKTGLLSIKNGQTKTFKFAISVAKGKLNDGVDTITALVVNQFDAHSQSDPGPTLTVHAPIVTLAETETFVKLTDDVVTGSKAKPTDKVVITNTGTDPLTTPITVGVYATPDDVPTDGGQVASITKIVKINPGKSATINLPLAGVPKLAAGSYKLITQVTQSNGTITITDPSTAPVVTVTAPTTGPLFSDSIVSVVVDPKDYVANVPLQGEILNLTKLTVNMQIINSGNTTNADGTPLKLFASTSSTFDSSAVQVGAITLNLGPINGNGGKRTFIAQFGVASDFPGSFDSSDTINDYIFVQITDPAGNVTMVSWPTAILFSSIGGAGIT